MITQGQINTASRQVEKLERCLGKRRWAKRVARDYLDELPNQFRQDNSFEFDKFLIRFHHKIYRN